MGLVVKGSIYLRDRIARKCLSVVRTNPLRGNREASEEKELLSQRHREQNRRVIQEQHGGYGDAE